MMLRVSLAAAMMFGGSLTAAFAADDTTPVEAGVSATDPALPHFEP